MAETLTILLTEMPFLLSLFAAFVVGISTVLLRRAAQVYGPSTWRLSWPLSACASAGYLWSFSWAWGWGGSTSRPGNPLLTVLGWLTLLAGIGIGLWGLSALGSRALLPRLSDRLETRPPYRYLRRPMDLGAILALLGVTAIVDTSSAWVCFWTWLALANFSFELEEWELRARIPAARDYMRKTPRYIPRWPGRRNTKVRGVKREARE